MDNRKTGLQGERLAANYLKKNGYQILHCNYKNSIGEIDIICQDGELLVFVEVKTRTNKKFGFAFEAVDRRKQEKIRRTAMLYIQEMDYSNRQLRFDIVEVYPNEKESIHHIINAFC